MPAADGGEWLHRRRRLKSLKSLSTGVDRVCLGFGTPQQRAIEHMTVAEARCYAAIGHFATGSMLPKIEAAIDFLEAGGREVITDPEHLGLALLGAAGTHITLAGASGASCVAA